MLATRGARLGLAVNGPTRALTLTTHRIPSRQPRQLPFVCFQCRSMAAEAAPETTTDPDTDGGDKPKPQPKPKTIRRSSADVTAEMHAKLAAAEAAIVALKEKEEREKAEMLAAKEREKERKKEEREQRKQLAAERKREREEKKRVAEERRARKREEQEKGMTEEEKKAFRAKEAAKKETKRQKKAAKAQEIEPQTETEPEPEPVRRKRPSPKRDAARKALEVKRAAKVAARQIKAKHARTKPVRPGSRNVHVSTPLAERLEATGLWKMRKAVAEMRGRRQEEEEAEKKGGEKVKGDRHRVNIVGEKLVDDVLDYIGSTLTPRHAGCDIIDIYPGAGLWSTKLHDLLQPRTHILLEPDVPLYTPFLQPLLDKPNVTLVPKTGIIWRELSNVLTPEYLPHQTEREIAPGATPTRNDTLLVTANLAFFPRRRFGTFESVSQLVLYQFINSIRASSLFNKYGLVRMLIWVEANDRHAIIARSIQRRKRLAIDGEVTTEYIAEVVGPDDVSPWFLRDSKLDLASTQQTLERMDKAGITIPPGREPKSVLAYRKLQAQTKGQTKGRKGKGKAPVIDMDAPPQYERPFLEELRDLTDMNDAGLIDDRSKTHRRLVQLQYRATHEAKVAERLHDMWKRMEAIARELETKTAKGEDLTATLAKQDEWNSEFEGLSNNDRSEFGLYRDNHHLFHQNFSGQTPVLAWDRRPVEPLVAKDDEFFPNAPCALIDIQPKAMNPLFRTVHSQSAFTSLTAPAHISQASDVFEAILRSVMGSSAEPISKSLEAVWPGAADGVLPHCPSLKDRAKGGTPVGGPYGELSGRSLNEEQWAEVVGAWMRWPFRPSLPQLVGRISEDANVDDEDLVD